MVVSYPHAALSQIVDDSTSLVRAQLTMLSATTIRFFEESRPSFTYARCIIMRLGSQLIAEQAPDARIPQYHFHDTAGEAAVRGEHAMIHR